MAPTKTEVPISGGGSGVHDPGVDVARERSERVARDGEPAVLPIQLPGAGEIRVGTASWTDPTMIVPGVFYPVGTDTAEERLGYYAGRLDRKSPRLNSSHSQISYAVFCLIKTHA